MPKELLPFIIFLLVFIFINIGIYFVIQLNTKEKIFRELFYYWLAVLFVIISEGLVLDGKLGLSLIFLTNLPAIFIMVRFILRSYNYTFNFVPYVIALPFVILCTYLFSILDLAFYITSAPVVLICLLPFFEATYVALFRYRHKSGLVEKMIGGVVTTLAMGCILNYGFNRFEATKLETMIGFGSAFACFIIYSILLPIYSIQQLNRKRTDLLEELVEQRTIELSKSKNEKEKLLRVLVHDISNPLIAAMHNANLIDESRVESNRLQKINQNLQSIKNIISHVVEYECVLSGVRTSQMELVKLYDCLIEAREIFADRFKEKNVHLSIMFQIPRDTLIKVDRVAFIHSLTSNLISNALKFSNPGEDVTILVYKNNDMVTINFIDNGIGMTEEKLQNVFELNLLTSENGTLGETGSGFGLPIVKAYTTLFGGQIEAFSTGGIKDQSGTTISLSLPFIENTKEAFSQNYLQ